MGMFNVLRVPETCASCGSAIQRRVQFGWGDTWLHEYDVGDTLRWGGNDIGDPGMRRVVVEAAAENCPVCGADGPEGEVIIERDVLLGWRHEQPDQDLVPPATT